MKMDLSLYPDNPYILLTPGPLSTSKTVKAAMLRDWCTWDDDYNNIVEKLRADLVSIATKSDDYVVGLMQGSGTFSVEACIGTLVPADGKLLVLANGVYGDRIGLIAEYLGIPCIAKDFGETSRVDPAEVDKILVDNPEVTHVAAVHCETTTGMLNPVKEIGEVVKKHGKVYIVDAMSSFGGVPIDAAEIRADALISSANKCIQGVPGFGFIVIRRDVIEACKGRARSLSLDLYSQWKAMDEGKGKWRFTSPTHVVRAFVAAMEELEEEGGVEARHARYSENQANLVKGMAELGFEALLPREWQSPIITSFISPDHPDYDFRKFYDGLKEKGFVVYPGKVTNAETFRIGNIGEVYPEDVERLLAAIQDSMYWK